MKPEDQAELSDLAAVQERASQKLRARMRWLYLGVTSLIGLGLLGFLHLRSQPPPPAPRPPTVPSPAALNSADRAAYDQAQAAREGLVVSAVASRIRRTLPPEPGGWSGDAWPAIAGLQRSLPAALEACGWAGHLRILDCRRSPCVARLEGGEAPAGACASWPVELPVEWSRRGREAPDTGQ